jgi:CSLREA domain-containing protein
MRARATVAAALALIVLAALAPRAGAATVIPNTGADDYDPVTPDANCSLREAIQAGNVFGDFGGCLYTGGDVGSVTILLSGGVTYERTLTDAAEEDTNATGDSTPCSRA